MRKTLAIVVLLMAVGASAGTITSLNPSTINLNSGEYFMTISGSNLGDQVQFSGPGGTFTLDINAQEPGNVVTWIPMGVVTRAGTYSVTVLGASGNSGPATFTVVNPNRVRWPLSLNLPDAVAVVAKGRSAVVNYAVNATDGEESTATVKCDPASGSLFGVGATQVNCSASNVEGEAARGSFTVFVHNATVPVLKLPGRLSAKADAKEGSYVKFEVSAIDEVDGVVPADCDTKSGSFFPVGITTIGCWASDASFNTGRGTFTVEVVDEQTKMALRVPDSVFAEAESKEGAVVTYDVYAVGTLDPNPKIECDPKSGSLFGIGTKSVYCRATDSFGASAEGKFEVTVADTTGPLLDTIKASPSVVNATGDYVGVTIDVKSFDAVDPMPQCSISYVFGSEALSEKDWSISAALQLKLQAITSGPDSRVYHVVVECKDERRNSSFGEALVTVNAK